MLSLMSLWMPILLAAVIVFIVSSIIHTVLGYHKKDFAKLDREDEVLDALRPMQMPPGQYMFPHMSHAECNSPEGKERLERGPVGLLWVLPNRMPSMGPMLGQWFAYCLVVSIFAAYVGANTLPPGTEYLTVFRVVGATAFAGYSLAFLQNAIWFHWSWGATGRFVFDGFIYGILTAGTFAWLWPAG